MSVFQIVYIVCLMNSINLLVQIEKQRKHQLNRLLVSNFFHNEDLGGNCYEISFSF